MCCINRSSLERAIRLLAGVDKPQAARDWIAAHDDDIDSSDWECAIDEVQGKSDEEILEAAADAMSQAFGFGIEPPHWMGEDPDPREVFRIIKSITDQLNPSTFIDHAT